MFQCKLQSKNSDKFFSIPAASNGFKWLQLASIGFKIESMKWGKPMKPQKDKFFGEVPVDDDGVTVQCCWELQPNSTASLSSFTTETHEELTCGKMGWKCSDMATKNSKFVSKLRLSPASQEWSMVNLLLMSQLESNSRTGWSWQALGVIAQRFCDQREGHVCEKQWNGFVS